MAGVDPTERSSCFIGIVRFAISRRRIAMWWLRTAWRLVENTVSETLEVDSASAG